MPIDARIPLAGLDNSPQQQGGTGGMFTISDIMGQRVKIQEIQDKNRELKDKDEVRRIVRASGGDAKVTIESLKKAGHLDAAMKYERELEVNKEAKYRTNTTFLKNQRDLVEGHMGQLEHVRTNPTQETWQKGRDAMAMSGEEGKAYADLIYGQAYDGPDAVRARMDQALMWGQSVTQIIELKQGVAEDAMYGRWRMAMARTMATSPSLEELQKNVKELVDSGMPKSYAEGLPTTWGQPDQLKAMETVKQMAAAGMGQIPGTRSATSSTPEGTITPQQKAISDIFQEADKTKAARMDALRAKRLENKVETGLDTYGNKHPDWYNEELTEIERAYRTAISHAIPLGWQPEPGWKVDFDPLESKAAQRDAYNRHVAYAKEKGFPIPSPPPGLFEGTEAAAQQAPGLFGGQTVASGAVTGAGAVQPPVTIGGMGLNAPGGAPPEIQVGPSLQLTPEQMAGIGGQPPAGPPPPSGAPGAATIGGMGAGAPIPAGPEPQRAPGMGGQPPAAQLSAELGPVPTTTTPAPPTPGQIASRHGLPGAAPTAGPFSAPTGGPTRWGGGTTPAPQPGPTPTPTAPAVPLAPPNVRRSVGTLVPLTGERMNPITEAALRAIAGVPKETPPPPIMLPPLDLTNPKDLAHAREEAKRILKELNIVITEKNVDAFLDDPMNQHNLNIVVPRKKK